MTDDHAVPSPDPFTLFDAWWREAIDCEEIAFHGAACLSTVDAEGRPDARMVIVREAGSDGFLFATDARSVKAEQLSRVPDAALTFYWPPLDRSVRIRGRVVVESDAVADRMMDDRPRRSRITPHVCHQSRPLDDRAELEARYRAVEKRFDGKEAIPRPDSWKAYRLVPSEIELWRAGRGRLHHRFAYSRDDADGWSVTLLEP